MQGFRPSILKIILSTLQDIEKLTIVNSYRIGRHMGEMFREMRYNDSGGNFWAKPSCMALTTRVYVIFPPSSSLDLRVYRARAWLWQQAGMTLEMLTRVHRSDRPPNLRHDRRSTVR